MQMSVPIGCENREFIVRIDSGDRRYFIQLVPMLLLAFRMNDE